MPELTIDFITSLDGCASGKGWPGWWGLEGPEYLAWLGEQPPTTLLMGANTYRMFHGFASGDLPEGADNKEQASIDFISKAKKVVFSSTLEEPLSLPNTTLVRGDAVGVVKDMKANGSDPMSTIGTSSCAGHCSPPDSLTGSAL